MAPRSASELIMGITAATHELTTTPKNASELIVCIAAATHELIMQVIFYGQYNIQTY